MREKALGTVVTAALSVLFIYSSAQADDTAADFYKGKNIFLQIGTSTAGSYNLMGRAVANHMAKHIPGKPTIVVQNNPNNMVLANQFGNTTPRDGTYFGLFVNGMPTIPLIDPQSGQFDARKFHFLGSPARETHLLVLRGESKTKTLDDVFTKETVVAGDAPGSAPTDYPRLTNPIIGTKFKIVSGYQSSGERTLAMQRGEVDGQAGSAWSNVKTGYKDMLANGEVRVVGIFGFRTHPELPNIPLFPLGKTVEDRQLFNLMYARQAYGKPFATPPDVPAERVEALRSAFVATMKDPEFIAEATKLGLDIDPVSAQELTDLTSELYKTPKEVLDRMVKLVSPESK